MTELIYTIDSSRGEQDNFLLIKIQEAERHGFILQPLENQRLLSKELLLKLQTPKDSAILPFLMAEEASYLKKKSGRTLDERRDPLSTIHVSIGATPQALKLFAMSGKLHFKNKSLAIDLFGKAEFYYQSIGEGKVEGRIIAGEQDFGISECDYIAKGAPLWYIKGIHLKSIATDLSWKDLSCAYKQQIRPLAELIQESKEDAEAPKVVGKSETPVPAADPLPYLCLQDRLGAFASLWMDYGNNKLVPFHLHAHEPNATLNTRNKIQESAWEKDLLETSYMRKLSDSSHYYCPVDKIGKSLGFLLEIGWQILDWKGNRVVQHGQTELTADSHGEQIILKGKIHYASFEADVSTIIGAFNRRERFVEIAAGYTALLPENLDALSLGALSEGEIVGKAIHMKRTQIGALAELLEKHAARTDSSLKELHSKLANFSGIENSAPGALFSGTLRPYQQEGLNWLAFLKNYHFHGILADDMGLGKTVQVLAFLSQCEFSSPTLIVMPTSLIFNWKKEFERFLPQQKVVVYYGQNRAFSLDELKTAQIILTTYTTLRLDFSLLSKLHYNCVILDEAQAIKNARTQTFQCVSKLQSDFRLSITGTPIENNLAELWAHFHFLMPDLLGDENAFKADLLAGQSDTRFFQRIKKTIRPFLLRRRKEQVALDLPEKIEQTVWVEMNPQQRAVYESFLAGIRTNLIKKVKEDGSAKHRMEILEAIMRLRQICCDPLLIGHDEACESSKLEALMQDIEIGLQEERKILIYSQFTSMLAVIGKRLQALGYAYVYLDGSTQNREKVVTQFQEDPHTKLFLISLKAGGIGLNLTAADYVFLYDPWWNAAVENQAIDRAHRIGRRDTVFAKRYIMIESIEEKMMKLKASKSALSADILDEERLSQSITPDELLFLLT